MNDNLHCNKNQSEGGEKRELKTKNDFAIRPVGGG